VVLPLHRDLDGKAEANSRQTKIGTTKRGIGPCYSDAIARLGIRIGDLYDRQQLTTRLQNIFTYHAIEQTPSDTLIQELMLAGQRFKPFLKQIHFWHLSLCYLISCNLWWHLSGGRVFSQAHRLNHRRV
jgi:adenylosuccinate synthase